MPEISECYEAPFLNEFGLLGDGGESTEIVQDDSALMTQNDLSPVGGLNETEVDSGSI